MKMASIVFLKIDGFLESICNYPEGIWGLWPQLCKLHLKRIFCSRGEEFGFKNSFHHLFLFFIFILLPFFFCCVLCSFCIFLSVVFALLQLKNKILISSRCAS